MCPLPLISLFSLYPLLPSLFLSLLLTLSLSFSLSTLEGPEIVAVLELQLPRADPRGNKAAGGVPLHVRAHKVLFRSWKRQMSG
jgi:hypothetical protein